MTATPITIVNTSTKHTAPVGVLDTITEALHAGQTDLSIAWGTYVHRITDRARSAGWKIVLLDNPDVADALGYHDLGPDGRPYSRVFLDPIFDNGGTWTRATATDGGLTVLEVADHEAKEMAIDPTANQWGNDAHGINWAREACDAVQAYAYLTTLKSSSVRVALSDFITPEWFNPFAAGSARLDWCDRLESPFQIAPGGYAIREAAGRITQSFGRAGELDTAAGTVYANGVAFPGRQPASFGSRRLARARWLAA